MIFLYFPHCCSLIRSRGCLQNYILVFLTYGAVLDGNEHYSVTYFIALLRFKALYRQTFVKGGAYSCFVDSSICEACTQHVFLTEVQRYSALHAVMQWKEVTE